MRLFGVVESAIAMRTILIIGSPEMSVCNKVVCTPGMQSDLAESQRSWEQIPASTGGILASNVITATVDGIRKDRHPLSGLLLMVPLSMPPRQMAYCVALTVASRGFR
jgi:hypothetical protein